jgi:cytochrome P450
MPSKLPPGPTDWLLGVRQLRRFKSDLLGYYTELAQKYGDTVCLRLGPYRSYVFFHPEQIREVLVAKARHFIKLPRFRKILAQLDGDGLVYSEGDFWLRQRRLMQPAFHARRLEGYGQAMVDQTRALVQSWKTQCGQRPVLTIDFERGMTDLTLAIVAATLFGSKPSSETARLGAAVAALSEIFTLESQAPLLFPDWFPLPRKKRKRHAIRLLNRTVDQMIRARRSSRMDGDDLLSMLLLAVDEEGDGQGMSDFQARHEAMTLFLAGHDTTAAGLTWLGYVLSTQQEAARRAEREVDRELSGRPPTYQDLPRLGYLEQVVKETLRLYPPAIGVFTRQATQDVEIGGYLLKKGSLVQLFSYLTQRDPRWFPEPENFEPERFEPERAKSIPAFAYFPFGGGPRVCIGNQFAMAEMVLVTAVLLQSFRFELVPEQGPVKLLPRLSLRPEGGRASTPPQTALEVVSVTRFHRYRAQTT